jgi:hypothetical protein
MPLHREWSLPRSWSLVPLAVLMTLRIANSLVADELTAPPVNFVRDVRPILSKHCFACHGPDEGHRKADLRLDVEASAKGTAAEPGVIVAGKAGASELVSRIISTDDEMRMPPPKSGPPLAKEQIDLIKRWIDQGAKWGAHWSFTPPDRPQPPTVKQAAWPKNDIDRFVLARLEREQLAPSPAVDRVTLIRRVSLDLTGLPPTPADVDAFVADQRPDAYEKLVDRLLASPAYGERMARMWLDLARYADTKGYEKDLRRTIWRYRDWVIDAFNRDLPFDQFTRDQLAGDLLPDATLDQRLATAFHRNTMVNDEGGTDDEEFRVNAVKDRVATTMQVWMGLTMQCANCHSHKYDPITQREHYQFYAFFNQTEDADRGDDQPVLATPTTEQQRQLAKLNTELAGLRDKLRTPTPALTEALANWEASLPPDTGWTLLKPSSMSAASGSTLKLLDDGSILADAKRPATEAYRVTLPTELVAVTGIKLEALPDKSHPKGGVGRTENDGNFVLSRISLSVKKPNGDVVEVPFAKAESDFSQANYPVDHAIKNDDLKKHGWAVSPQQTKAHMAVFTTAHPVAAGVGTELTITLDHQFEFAYPGFSIGRFRLSATADAQPVLSPALPTDIRAIVKTPADARTAEQKQKLFDHFVSIAAQTKPLREQIAVVEGSLKAVNAPQTPVLKELAADKRRVTKLHVRGNFLEPGDAVEPAVPAAFHPFPDGAPLNRLGVAMWLVDERNPLTARVMTNRFWAIFFGTGLVETQEDFGSQGMTPSHPELLDWLAWEFREPGLGSLAPHPRPLSPGGGEGRVQLSRWSMKRLCKVIAMSATYQQSSRITPELAERDRFNRLLARGPRFRLEAEMVRDAALAASGLLSRKLGGPSVMPPQPPGIWQSTYNSEKWVVSAGEDKYRRGMYTFLKRTSPYPSMLTFDAPSREVCTIRRITTNTPLQALVTLNDPVYIEAAQALARRMVKEGGSTTESRLSFAFRQITLRSPSPREADQLATLFRRRHDFYRAATDAAREMATSELGPLPDGMDVAELAAYTNVCNVLLNLDEFLMRG